MGSCGADITGKDEIIRSVGPFDRLLPPGVSRDGMHRHAWKNLARPIDGDDPVRDRSEM